MKTHFLLHIILFVFLSGAALAQQSTGEPEAEITEVKATENTPVNTPANTTPNNSSVDSQATEGAQETTNVSSAKKNESTAQPDSSLSKPEKVASQWSELLSFSVLFSAILGLIVTFLGSRFSVAILENFSERLPQYRLTLKRLIPVTRFVVWIAGLYIVIYGIIAPPLETVYTILASVGIAVGFASQDILKNIFGGIIIILDRPFQVGDKIDIGGHYGEVSHIGLRSTRLVTPDDSVVSVPNGELMNKSVSNANSGALDCQVVAEIYLPSTVNLALVKKWARLAAATSPYIYLNKPIAVVLKHEFDGIKTRIKVRIKAYVIDIRHEFAFMTDMTQRAILAFKKEGLMDEGAQEESLSMPRHVSNSDS